MSDIAFVNYQSLPKSWRVICDNHKHQLGVLDGCGQFEIQVLERDHIIIAVLSHTTNPEELFNDIIKYKSGFMSHIGHVSGIVWNTYTDEFCIFRDPFGFVPWMLTYYGSGCMEFSAVTSPEYQAELTRGRGVRRNWLARYLLEEHSMSDDDIYENTGRLLPGEYLSHVIGSFDEFVSRLTEGAGGYAKEPDEKRICQIRHCVWHDKKYHVIDADQAELAVALREKIAKAVSRIPEHNPCFTLSGGLDSTAILSTWCAANAGRYDAVSLVSRRHRSCDESHELDVLEAALPVSLTRVCMDDFWALKEPELYGKFSVYGPLVAPGIESLLGAYRAVEKVSGPRLMVTGYGGNFLVQARKEAIFRDLWARRDLRGIAHEIKALDKTSVRYLVLRFLANSADGDIRRLVRCLRPNRRQHPDRASEWLNALFAAQFSDICVDPVFGMSHTQERALSPLLWNWELRTRCMDMLARLCPHRFYDPLFDTELYDFCACIPPQYFLNCGEYRPIYKEALKPLLPDEIVHHPKCQSFDMLIHDGLSKYARPLIEDVIRRGYWGEVLDKNGLLKAYEQYCLDAAEDEPGYEMTPLWRSISLLLWAHFS